MSLAVNAISLIKQFGQIHALDGVSFSIKPGNLFSIVGSQGTYILFNFNIAFIVGGSLTADAFRLRKPKLPKKRLLKKRFSTMSFSNIFRDILDIRVVQNFSCIIIVAQEFVC